MIETSKLFRFENLSQCVANKSRKIATSNIQFQNRKIHLVDDIVLVRHFIERFVETFDQTIMNFGLSEIPFHI